MKRLFFALWPDEITRDKLEGLNQNISGSHLKKVKRHNFHVTLVFLGQVSVISEQAIRQSVRGAIFQLQTDQIEIMFDQFTLWKKGGILSLSSTQQERQLLSLVSQLRLLVEEQGVELEQRPYIAHITLARKAQMIPDTSFEPLCWRSHDFALVESVSTPNGVEYQVLERWPLSS